MYQSGRIVAFVGLLFALATATPASAQGAFSNLSARAEALGGDRYRVTASGTLSGHPMGARFELHEVSDTGDTLVFEPVMVAGGPGHTATVWPFHASVEVDVPQRIRQIEVRGGSRDIVVALEARNADDATTDTLRGAIERGHAVTFSYGNETVAARPQRIYRVPGDSRSIVQCLVSTEKNGSAYRSFYISQISNVRDISEAAR